MITRPYGVGALFKIATLDGAGSPPGVAFATGTFVAGDLKRSTDQLALGNLTAEFVAFTSGSEEPVVGDTLDNNSQTAVYIGSKLTSGTWAGGDAAGTMFLEQVSGALASGTTGISGGTADVCTFSADATAAIGGLAIGDELWFALTAAEMSCKQGMVLVEDQGASVWAADGITFETYGNAAAMHPTAEVDLVDAPNATALAAIGTTAMVEAYAADGATMTPAQALYEIKALLSEYAVSSTTVTIKGLDGTTAKKTYTLNSATDPTSITGTT